MEPVIRQIKQLDSGNIAANLFIQSDEKEVESNILKDLKLMEAGIKIRCVAEIEGKIVGQASFIFPESPIKKHLVEVLDLVVNDEYQGRGISSRLTNYGLDWAIKHGVKLATISVRKGTKAEKIFKQWGFQVYGELKNGIEEPWGERKVFDEIFLVKNLIGED